VCAGNKTEAMVPPQSTVSTHLCAAVTAFKTGFTDALVVANEILACCPILAWAGLALVSVDFAIGPGVT